MNSTTDWSHRTVLPAEPVSTSRTRDFVCLHLVEHNLRHLVEDVRLVASELATNAMTHAQTAFTVTLSQTDDMVLLTVRDGSSSPPVRAIAQVLDSGGRGLMIVELLSQDWGVTTDRRDAKEVWASFAAGSAPPASVSA
jgi:anti-sigma regulatory factor (Ser/Thr protein kinase)